MQVAPAGDRRHPVHRRERVVAQTLGVLLRLEVAAALPAGCRPFRALRPGDLEPLRVDDIEDDALLSELLRGPPYLVFEGLDAAVRAPPSAPVTLEIEIPPPIHTRFLRPGMPDRCCPRLSIAARVFEPEARACALASMSVSSWLRAISTASAAICRLVREHLDELFGLHHRLVHVDCGRERHGDERLVDAVPQRIGVVGKVVEDAEPIAHLVDRHPCLRREGLEVSHRHRADAHAGLGWRVELVQEQRRDVARRSGGQPTRLVKSPAGSGLAFGSVDGRPRIGRWRWGDFYPPRA